MFLECEVREQKAAKQREGCTLHSDMCECTLLLRQPLITLWLLDQIQILPCFGNGVPGSDTEILRLTASADKFLQKKWHGRRQSESLFHTSSLLSRVAKQQQPFHSVCSWPRLLNLLQTGELKV